MILIAPAPMVEYVFADGAVYRADHRQVIRDVLPEHAVELLSTSGCAAPKPVIVAHGFPDGMSVHCFACGEFLEMPEGRDPWYWLADGQIIVFVDDHKHHATDLVLKPPAPTQEVLEGGKMETAGGAVPAGLIFSPGVGFDIAPPEPKPPATASLAIPGIGDDGSWGHPIL